MVHLTERERLRPSLITRQFLIFWAWLDHLCCILYLRVWKVGVIIVLIAREKVDRLIDATLTIRDSICQILKWIEDGWLFLFESGVGAWFYLSKTVIFGTIYPHNGFSPLWNRFIYFFWCPGHPSRSMFLLLRILIDIHHWNFAFNLSPFMLDQIWGSKTFQILGSRLLLVVDNLHGARWLYEWCILQWSVWDIFNLFSILVRVHLLN